MWFVNVLVEFILHNIYLFRVLFIIYFVAFNYCYLLFITSLKISLIKDKKM